MLNFLENHDEQRIASDYFASNPIKAIPGLIVSSCMNTNPMMIYFGQEFGELGMDTEGYSGRDGRTTIFDYWSVDTIRQWRNEGRYNSKLLSQDQLALYKLYQKILNISANEKAIVKGSFFDLMYANLDGWKFNPHKQYIFFRKYEDELLLIVVNFDNQPVEIAVNIPAHAFDYLQLPHIEAYQAQELISDKKESICLLPDKATEINLKAFSCKILKIKL